MDELTRQQFRHLWFKVARTWVSAGLIGTAAAALAGAPVFALAAFAASVGVFVLLFLFFGWDAGR